MIKIPTRKKISSRLNHKNFMTIIRMNIQTKRDIQHFFFLKNNIFPQTLYILEDILAYSYFVITLQKAKKNSKKKEQKKKKEKFFIFPPDKGI